MKRAAEQPWQLRTYKEQKAAVDQELAELSPKDAVAQAFTEAFDEALWTKNGNHLRRLLLALNALQLNALHGGLREHQERSCAALAEHILKSQGIRPHVSRLAFLYFEVQDALAACARRRGQHFHAAWLMRLGRAGDAGSEDSANQALADADAALRNEDSRSALLAYESLAWKESSTAQGIEASLGYLRTLRLRGDILEARLLAQRLKTSDLPSQHRLRLEWERLCLEAAASGDLTDLVRFVRRLKVSQRVGEYLMVYLWANASKQMRWQVRVVPPTKVWRRARRQCAPPRPLADFYKCARELEACEGKDLALRDRLMRLGEILSEVPHLDDPEHKLLVWAAASRWLARHHQGRLAELTLAEYRGLCLRLSGGQSEDIYGVVDDLDLKALSTAVAPALASDGASKRPRLAHGRIDMTFELARLAAGFVRLVAKGALFDRPRFVEMATRYAASRRGVVLKIMQTLSYVDDILSNEVASAFDIIQTSIPKIPADRLNQIFCEDFGKSPGDLFKRFDPEPFAAGSVGQVHLAMLDDGMQVAVKVQYPDIERVIDFDMRQAKIIRPLIIARFPNLDFEMVVEEAYKHVQQELDYRQELANLTEFRAAFAEDEDIVIPKPVPKYCSRRVLTAEYLAGETLVDFVSHASEEQRRKVTAAIAKFATRSFYQLHMFNADVQPSNFVFFKDRIGCIDFGCVKRLPPEVVADSVALQKAVFLNDAAGIGDLYKRMGFLPDDLQVDDAVLLSMLRTTQKHNYTRNFRYSPEYAREQRQAMIDQNPYRKYVRVPKEQVMALRCDPGYTSILSTIAAQGDWYEVIAPLIFGEREPFWREGVASS